MRAFLSTEIDGQLLSSHKIQIGMCLHPLNTKLTQGRVMIPAGTFAPRSYISVANDGSMRSFAGLMNVRRGSVKL